MENYEPSCCFDTSAYTGKPDAAATAMQISVPKIIAELDNLYNSGRESEAGDFLRSWRKKAAEAGDWRGELSMLSELMGHYRRDRNEEAGLEAVYSGLNIIKKHNMGYTVSGATVMLNAATTLKCFGRAQESLDIFRHVGRIYSNNLDRHDYRFGGLYNNMALTYVDVGSLREAEKHFKLAMEVISYCENPDNELAVTLCNMAEMYDRVDPEDERIAECMEKAWGHLNSPDVKHDGYHAFTISKCAPSFDYFGYFLYSKALKERAEKIYEGN